MLFSFLHQPSLILGLIRLLLHTAASSLVVLGTTSKSLAAFLWSPLKKKKRDIKRLLQGSVDMNIAEPLLSLKRRVDSLHVRTSEGDGGCLRPPHFGPFLCNHDRGG